MDFTIRALHRYQRGRESAEGYFHDSFNYQHLRSQLLDPLETTVERAVRRDAARGGDEETTRQVYEVRYVPGQRLYLSSCKPETSADVVFDNGVFDDARVTARA